MRKNLRRDPSPYTPPPSNKPNRPTIKAACEQVIARLDAMDDATKAIEDPTYRAAVKKQIASCLKTVSNQWRQAL